MPIWPVCWYDRFSDIQGRRLRTIGQADRGRRFGFAGVEVFPGGEGELVESFGALGEVVHDVSRLRIVPDTDDFHCYCGL